MDIMDILIAISNTICHLLQKRELKSHLTNCNCDV